MYKEKTTLVSFDIMLIRQDPKTRRNVEACRAIPRIGVEPPGIMISKETNIFFYLSGIIFAI